MTRLSRELKGLLARDGKGGRSIKEDNQYYEPWKFFSTNNEQLGRFNIVLVDENQQSENDDKGGSIASCAPNLDE